MVPPDANFEDLSLKIRNHMELHIFAQRDVRDFDLLIKE